MFPTTFPLFPIILSAVTALYCSPSCAEWVEWLADATVSGQYDNNINQSFFNATRLDDFIGKAFLSGGRAYQFDPYTRAYTTLEWNGETHENFPQLNQYGFSGKGVLTHKFGLGHKAPVLRMDVADGEIFSDSQLRSGNQFTSGLRLSSWYNEFQQIYIGYRFDNRDAARKFLRLKNYAESPFSVQGHSLELGSNITVSGRMQLHLGYGHRWGDITSNNTPSSLTPAILSQVSSISDDDALSGWVYRASGNTDYGHVGLSYALWDGHAATALNYSYSQTEAVGMGYENHRVQLSVHYSY
jgi:hypothetical protein